VQIRSALLVEVEVLPIRIPGRSAPPWSVYWHQPVFSATDSIAVPEGPTAVAFWQLPYQYGADLGLNGHDHLYARYRPLDPSGNYDPKKGIREFIVGTGGETLDPIVTTNTTAADPTGNPNFNAENLEAGTGEFWGVMGLTLNENGYAWDFESALKDPAQTIGPATFSDKGVGSCHGPVKWWSDRNVFATLGCDLASVCVPPREKSRRGELFSCGSI